MKNLIFTLFLLGFYTLWSDPLEEKVLSDAYYIRDNIEQFVKLSTKALITDNKDENVNFYKMEQYIEDNVVKYEKSLKLSINELISQKGYLAFEKFLKGKSKDIVEIISKVEKGNFEHIDYMKGTVYYNYKMLKVFSNSIINENEEENEQKRKDVISSDLNKLERNCKKGFFDNCVDAGVIYYGNNNNNDLAQELFSKACDNNNAEGCYYLGLMAENKEGGFRFLRQVNPINNIDPAIREAMQFYKKSCEKEYLKSCSKLGQLYYIDKGEGIHNKHKKAFAILKKSCDKGSDLGCYYLGKMLMDKGIYNNERKAAFLFKKACDGGNMSGCFDLGTMYYTGKGIEKNKIKAAKLYEIACNNNNMLACYHLGLHYFLIYNKDVEEEKGLIKKAAKLFIKSCKEGIIESCEFLCNHIGDEEACKIY